MGLQMLSESEAGGEGQGWWWRWGYLGEVVQGVSEGRSGSGYSEQ